jgi:hypothetical protein
MRPTQTIEHDMTAAEAELLAEFLKADTIRLRIEAKRRATALGYHALADRMMRELLPSGTVRLEVLPG